LDYISEFLYDPLDYISNLFYDPWTFWGAPLAFALVLDGYLRLRERSGARPVERSPATSPAATKTLRADRIE
jgi:hypothetical protein